MESGLKIYAWHLAFQIKLYYHDDKFIIHPSTNDAKITKLLFFLSIVQHLLTEQKPFENVYCASCYQFHMVTWIQKIKLINLS